MKKIDGVQVFSASTHADRQSLGERVSDWRQSHPKLEMIESQVVQSSDSEFHCVTIVLFWAIRR